MGTPEKKIPISLEWGNLRHDEDLERLLNPCRPSGAEFAQNAEKQIFCCMREWKIWKIYVWDEFRSADETTARWDWCFAPVRPENKACREESFAHLVAMDDRQFERLVRSLPKSPNEDIVREWRDELRKDPLIVNAARAEANPVDWRDCEYDPDLIKKELL